jgi:hypothetical protein
MRRKASSDAHYEHVGMGQKTWDARAVMETVGNVKESIYDTLPATM